MTSRLAIGSMITVLVVAGLIFLTIRSSSPTTGATGGEREAAIQECERSVRDEVAGARFPFAPRFEDGQGGSIHLSGTVDSGSGIQAQRRNYDCYVSPHGEGAGYVADSVHVWQSH